MPDLDMSNVQADADAAFNDYLDELSTPDIHLRGLEQAVRIFGPDARAGEPHSVAVMQAVAAGRLYWHECSLVEREGDAYAMAAADAAYYDYDREAEEYALGRPLLPNEY